MTIDNDIRDRALAIVRDGPSFGAKIATAESCTGGLIGSAITNIDGSSAVFDCGFITYSNEAKAAMLGVPPALIAAHGAVSEDVARAMAEGALARSNANLAVAVTGIAGPGGGTEQKPVGFVCFGLAEENCETHSENDIFVNENRETVRKSAVATALQLLIDAMRARGRSSPSSR